MPRTRGVRRRRSGERGTVLNDASRAALMDAVAKGVPIQAACSAAGINPRTFYRWMSKAEAVEDREEAAAAAAIAAGQPAPPPEPRSPNEVEWCQLRLDVDRARAAVAVRYVDVVDRVAQGGSLLRESRRTYTDDQGRDVTEVSKEYTPPNWRAAAFILSAVWRKEFGREDRLVRAEVTGPNGQPLQVTGAADLAALSERIQLQAAQRTADAIEAGVVDAELVEDS